MSSESVSEKMGLKEDEQQDSVSDRIPMDDVVEGERVELITCQSLSESDIVEDCCCSTESSEYG